MNLELTTIQHYKDLALELDKIGTDERYQLMRHLCRTDLFFLLYFGCGRIDMAHQWLLDRCKEIQKEPDEYLDLWAREHYKSTIITFGKTIQDILASHGENPLPEWNNVEPTFVIFSHTRPQAKDFLKQIKREFENNSLLKKLFPDIIWENPEREAPKWSEDAGLIFKRKSNPKECTVEAWGIVDGQPTGKHFTVCIYDDVVTKDRVSSPDMIKKTTEAWELSINLGSEHGKRRYIGTRYAYNDTYLTMMKRQAVKPRIYKATKEGTADGEPVLQSKEYLRMKRINMGPYTFACQMLQDPLQDETESLHKEWMRWHGGSNGDGLNKYIVVDPASEKKKTSDYTVMAVIGLGSDQNYYLLDMVRDRLNLLQRADNLFRLHRKWRPLNVGYEKYGLQADIEHIRDRQTRENYHFNVEPVAGAVSKNDRIKRIIPSLSEGRWYFPDSIFKTNYEGRIEDLMDIFIHEEFTAFPVAPHDDMLDAISRIFDQELNVIWPGGVEDDNKHDRYTRARQYGASAWAA